MIGDKNDKNIVRNAMIVIFLSLIIVYVIWYQVNGSNNSRPGNSSPNTTIADSLVINSVASNTGTTMNDPLLESDWQENDTQEENTNNTGDTQDIDTSTGDNTEQNQQEIEVDDDDTIREESNQDMKILSWTTLYFGPIEWIDTLDINYSYALRDDRNIYFTYLENEPDLSSIARSLGWTLYTMNTETEIVRNELFGNRIIFINLSEYQNDIVLMYVEVWQEKWLLQISYNIYHESKRYLQNLFID